MWDWESVRSWMGAKGESGKLIWVAFTFFMLFSMHWKVFHQCMFTPFRRWPRALTYWCWSNISSYPHSKYLGHSKRDNPTHFNISFNIFQHFDALKAELANCQDVLVSRPTLAKSARPRDQWSLIAKELIDKEGPFKETCVLALVFANCTCRYKFFPLVSKITPFLLL